MREGSGVLMINEKVYIIHDVLDGKVADFFVFGAVPVLNDEDAHKRFSIDYYKPNCPYIRSFLAAFPEYTYVGSTYNMHNNGWGMSFDGYEKVERFPY